MAKQLRLKEDGANFMSLGEADIRNFIVDEEGLCRSMDEKRDTALLLSSELAEWFGDVSIQTNR